MTAVRVDVSGREEFCHPTRRVSPCYADGSYGVGSKGDIKGGKDVRLERDCVKKRSSGYVDCSKIREVGDLVDRRPFDDVEDGEVEGWVDEDRGVVLPPEKRRKFSPVVWDKGTKSLRHKRIVVSDHELDESPADMLSSLTQLTGSSDEQEPGQLDEEDFSRAPNISTSRWAFDEEEEDKSGKRGKSVPSDAFECEGSGGATDRSFGSDRGHRSGSGSGSELDIVDFMEVDDTEDGDPIADQTSSYSEEDAADLSVPDECRRHMLTESRSVHEYERLGKISEGSYGVVYRAKDKITGEMVALKKLKMGVDREGFPMHYLREINSLMSFNHPSIINVKEVVLDDSSDGLGNVYMVMEYMEHDLKALMESRKQPFSQSEVKCLMLQLLEGVRYLHDNWLLHRDLKTSNLLLNNKGEMKICDFGMARQYGSPLKPYTQLVVTLWYRAPELLLGSKEYSTAVDMWSVGCVMAELLANKPLFDGKTELEQLNKIFRTLGTPNEKIWPGYSKLPGLKVNYAHQPYNKLREKFPRTSFTGSPVLSDLGFDLLSKLLMYNPEKRISAEDALDHAWFHEVPLPKSKDFMPTFPVRHAGKR